MGFLRSEKPKNLEQSEIITLGFMNLETTNYLVIGNTNSWVQSKLFAIKVLPIGLNKSL